MRKILTIAVREYRAMVGTKAFVLSIIMMPILMLGGLLAIELLKNSGDTKTLKIAVIDPASQLVTTLENAAIGQKLLVEQASQKGSQDDDDGFPAFSKEVYEFEFVTDHQVDDTLRLELSDRIRDGDLYAFVEVPPDLNGGPSVHADEEVLNRSIRFYAQNSSLSEARNWLSQVINGHLINERLKAAKVDPEIVKVASRRIPVTGVGLVSTSDDSSEIFAAEESNPMKEIFLPMAVMMLMFMVIFMASQPMLESVLEEKSQRIAEVLLGSANPFQLMLGKLLGTVAGSLTVFGIYLAGMLGFAIYRGWSDQIPFDLIPWFIVFQVIGVLFYASIFMAVGASVSQLKEAQSMLLPVWMLLMSPMFVWIFIVRDPTGSMATCFSLFPPATPTTMMLRMATGVSIPVWQPFLGLVLTLIGTLVIVILASRIFRVGILWQGKTPKLGEILRWAIGG